MTDFQADYNILEVAQQWTCEVCTFENPEFNAFCSMCESPQPQGGGNGGKQAAVAAGEKKPSHVRHISLSSLTRRQHVSMGLNRCQESAQVTRAKLQEIARRSNSGVQDVDAKPYFTFAMERPSFWLPQLVFSDQQTVPSAAADPEQNEMLVQLEKYERGLERWIRERLVDNVAQTWLEQTTAVNKASPDFGSQLTAFRTAQDHNSLLHALCLAMWGVHDSTGQLRACLQLSLDFPMREKLQARLSPEDGSVSQTWADLLEAIKEKRELTPAHVMIMTYVLRRPIVIFSAKSLPAIGDAPEIKDNPWRGIYVPDLLDHDCGKDECTINFNRNPLFLGYTPSLRATEDGKVEAVPGPGRFVPLLWTEGSNPDPAIVPLFDLNEEGSPVLLPVRFLPPGGDMEMFLQRYFIIQTSPQGYVHCRFAFHASSKSHTDMLWRNYVISAKAAFEEETGMLPPQGYMEVEQELATMSLLDEGDDGKESLPGPDDEKEAPEDDSAQRYSGSLGEGNSETVALALLRALTQGKSGRYSEDQAWPGYE